MSTGMSTGMSMSTTMDMLNRLHMLQICDSLFPIGAFALSNGLETFVQAGAVSTVADLQRYLHDYTALLPYQELGMMTLAARCAGDSETIAALDARCAALRAPMEVRQGSARLAMRLIKAAEQLAPMAGLEEYRKRITAGECIGQHPIAVGLYTAENGLALMESAVFYGYSMLSAITTNTVKSVPLRQLDGQKALRGAFPGLLEAARRACTVTMEELGIGGPAFDIFAMNHEVLYSRLYMS